MAIARWQPADELATLHSMMDRFFGDLSDATDGGRNTSPMRRLAVDISETKDAYIVKAPLPGFRPEDVELTFADGVLSIKAKHHEEKQEKEGNYLRREVMYGDFQRQIMVPGDVKSDHIAASFENGVLKIELPRAPRPQPAKIEVKANKEGSRQPELVGSGSKRS